jgi:D-arabinonate dehydratase
MAEIARVQAVPLSIPLARPIGSALAPYTAIDGMAVLVEDAAGTLGTGFTMSLGGNAARTLATYVTDELAPALVGTSPDHPETAWHAMWAPNKPRMRAGLGVWALSAVDIAVWDLHARQLGLPLHEVLGGSASRIPVYGSGGWHTLDDDELVAEAESFAALGIAAYKFKLGTVRDPERIGALRAALGDAFVLYADANQSLAVDEAIEVSRMLADFGVGWLEEPVVADSVDMLVAVAAGSAVPVAAGENVSLRWQFAEILERHAVAFIQPDVVRCGGVTEFRRVAAMAAEHEIALSTHLWHQLHVSLIGTSPAMHLAEYAPLLPSGIFTQEFPVVDGHLGLPDGPGHGVAFAPGMLERYAR